MAFPSRFGGSKCAAGEKCVHGGRIERGEMINWSRRGEKRVWHADCNELIPDYVPQRNYNYQSQQTQSAQQTYPVPETLVTPNISSANGSGNYTDGLAALIATAVAPMLEERLKSKVDEQVVLDLVASASSDAAKIAVDAALQAGLKGMQITQVHRIEITERKDDETTTTRDMGIQHKSFPQLLQLAQARDNKGAHIPIWISGPAGSGKTSACETLAKSLGYNFVYSGAIDTPYPLKGFIDANGKLVRTAYRDAYEHGKAVFLFDEYDGSSANATLPFNADLANGAGVFPDGIIPRHPDTLIIAAANTWGLGATTDYVGRNKMDAANLDRFLQLTWDYDEDLERSTCGNPEWALFVQVVRSRVRQKGIKVLVTPRASYYGAALLAQGIPQSTVETITLKKAMTAEQWESVRR